MRIYQGRRSLRNAGAHAGGTCTLAQSHPPTRGFPEMLPWHSFHTEEVSPPGPIVLRRHLQGLLKCRGPSRVPEPNTVPPDESQDSSEAAGGDTFHSGDFNGSIVFVHLIPFVNAKMAESFKKKNLLISISPFCFILKAKIRQKV